MATRAKRGGRGQSPKPEPEVETKRDKFLRLGNPRVQRVLNSIRLVGNLASPNYQWNPGDIEKMRDVIMGQLTKTLARFEKQERGATPAFEFEKEEQF